MSNRLPILVGEITAAHRACRQAGRAFVEQAITAGQRLNEAKQLVAHGEWAPWLVANVPQLSARTAQRYMRAADKAGKCDTVSFLTVRDLIAPASKRTSVRAFLPIAGEIKILLAEEETRWTEIWVAPSFQHAGYFYATRIETDRRSGEADVAGLRAPVRGDFLTATIIVLAGDDVERFRHIDQPSAPWVYNHLLFGSTGQFVQAAEGVVELAALAAGQPPADDVAFNRRAMRHAHAPFYDLVFADALEDAEATP